MNLRSTPSTGVAMCAERADSSHRRGWLGLALLVAWSCSGPAQALPPQPVITYAFPAGAARGQTVEITIHGRDLQDAHSVRLTGGGITTSIVEVVNANAVRVSVTVAPDADLRERDLRLITPGGVSNRVRFSLGAVPEINEVEPNTQLTQPQHIEAWPVLINGQILDNDRDYFRLRAQAGQTIVCDVQARTLLPYLPDTVPGFLDACLTLYDPSGKAFVSVDRFRHQPDPVLIYTIPADGEYTLEISDVIYRGRGDFIYRLAIGAGPHLTHVFPLGGQRNTSVQLALSGVGLPTAALDFPVPADSPAARVVGPLPGAIATNRLPFDVGDYPETSETEPNDILAQATAIHAPVVLNGRIQQPGDVDYFALSAEAHQPLVLDIWARRLGSPLDSFLSILDSQGAVLAENDDFVDLDSPLLLHHADSRLAFTFPATGDYILRVRDTQGKGGDEYAYRLVVAPPEPDMVLRMIPDMQRVSVGDSVVVTVTAEHRNGVSGDINLSVENLPAGFFGSSAIIPAGQTQAKLTITAPPDASIQVVAPHIVGTVLHNNQALTRIALGAEDVMQAFSFRHVVPTQEFVVAVVATSLFRLSTNRSPLESLQVKPGSAGEVLVHVTRQEGERFPIHLSVVEAPLGITVNPLVIAADQDEVSVTLTVPAETPPGGKVNVILSGTMSTGPETATRTLPAIPLQIVPEA